MNFDTDGKKYRITQGQGFMVEVNINGRFFPSFGVTRKGIFFCDLMVDSNGEGSYKRQTQTRWVTTKLIQYVIEHNPDVEGLKALLNQLEIVNAPNASTHQLFCYPDGNICVVEPGRKNLFSTPKDSNLFVMTNFPLSDYEEILPRNLTGSGADRYQTIIVKSSLLKEEMTIEEAFRWLKSVKQDGPDWTTQLSLVYDATNHVLYYCQDRDFEHVIQIAIAC
ncbi:MAG: hypothetical protein V2J07_07080 [Anaerolineae bacterium]|jgi:hypothetical protein|nr:hypothetical protein [Anaerolineae bacterium]